MGQQFAAKSDRARDFWLEEAYVSLNTPRERERPRSQSMVDT